MHWMKSPKSLFMRIFNSSLKNKKGNFAMTDPTWIVQKADQFDAYSNRLGAIPRKMLVVFFTRIAKQAVLIPMLQVNTKRGKTWLSACNMGSPNYTADSSPSKMQCPFILMQMKIGIFVKENYFCMYLAVKSWVAFLTQWHHHIQVGPHSTDVLSCAVISLSLKH